MSYATATQRSGDVSTNNYIGRQYIVISVFSSSIHESETVTPLHLELLQTLNLLNNLEDYFLTISSGPELSAQHNESVQLYRFK